MKALKKTRFIIELYSYDSVEEIAFATARTRFEMIVSYFKIRRFQKSYNKLYGTADTYINIRILGW